MYTVYAHSAMSLVKPVNPKSQIYAQKRYTSEARPSSLHTVVFEHIMTLSNCHESSSYVNIYIFFYSMSALLGSADGECMLHLNGFHLFYISVLYSSWCCVHCVGDKS